MIFIYEDFEALSVAAAGLFIQQARQAIEKKGKFCVALSGGETPHRTYELLAQPPYRNEIDWEKVYVFWGDERCVPDDDSRSNAHMAHQAWLDQVPIPGEQLHPMVCVTSNSMLAAQLYENVLQDFFSGYPPSFDLVLLGLGPDGHTASLLPGSPALQDNTRWVADVYPPDQGIERITLTPLILNQAAQVAFIVSGTDKAWVLKEVLQGPYRPLELPAQMIKPGDGKVQWLLDRAAASLLKQEA